MAKKKSDKNINIKIDGNTQGTTIIVGDSNVVGQGMQKPVDIKSRFLVPFPHNPDFVGRDEELSSLHETLQQKQSIVGIRPTVLVGLGGIGKTQLAVEYAHAYRDDYPSGVFWLNAINPLLIEFSDLAEKLELSDRDTPRDKAARKAWNYLDSHPDALVIFDNVLEPSQLNLPFSPDLVPANLRCCTLFTTRQRDFPRTFQPFEVKVLPEMAAMKLLLRSRPEVLEEHHPEWGWARIVCAYLGWLPLALELAGAYLGAYPEVSITGYLERLRTEGSLETVDASEVRAVDLLTRVEEILKTAAAGNLEIKHQVAVSATLQTQWKRLDDEAARLLFRAAGQFPEASWIPIPRLGLLTGIESEAKAGRPSPLNVVLKKLHAVSLIEELSDDRLRLHPLVQGFAARLSPHPASFCLEMAERVATEFSDLMRLQTRVINYGIDMTLEDIRIAFGFCVRRSKSRIYTRILKMERVLDRQAHGLRNWNSQEEPAFFFQQILQIRKEPFAQGLTQWQSQAKSGLARLKRPYLFERFPIQSDSAELRTLAGHSGVVHGVALSADGKLAVSASADKTLKVWDIPTGHELRTLIGHNSEVTCVTLSADGMLAVSSDWKDNTLKVWDVVTGRELRTLKGHSYSVESVALSADGRLAVSSAASLDDRSLIVWDVTTGRELRTLKGHSYSVKSVALSANGMLAVSAESDETIKVWNVKTGRKMRTLTSHSDELNAVTLSADGQLVASATDDNSFKVWDVTSRREIHTFRGHSDEVNAIILSADGMLAVSASSDETLKVWDISAELNDSVSARHELHALRETVSDKMGIALSADGKLAISASNDNTLKVWDVATGRELRTFKEHSDLKSSIALSANGKLSISTSNDHILKVWDVATGRELRTLKEHSDLTINIVNADGQLPISVNGVALSADGRLAVSASVDKTLKVWDITTGRELHTLTGHSGNVNGVALSSNGQLAVSTSDDRSLKVWDIITGRELRTLIGHSNWVNSVALSADGRLAVSASADKTLKVWDVTTGSELHTLMWHSKWIPSLALTSDGRLAVSASEDKTLKVWDIQTGVCITTLLVGASLDCCAISADGKTIVARDRLNRVHFLELVDAGEIQAPDNWLDVLIEESKIKVPVQEEVMAHSTWFPRWLKRLLGRKD